MTSNIIAVSQSLRFHAVSCRTHDGTQIVLTRAVLGDDGGTVDVPIPHRISGSSPVVSETQRALPGGPAHAEAVLAQVIDGGAEPIWGEPDVVADARALATIVRARAVSSVELMRVEPSLLPGLQIGGWYGSPWRARLGRRVPRAAAVVCGSSLRDRLDRLFWRTVRRACCEAEWRRLTRSSYVALLYHRLAGEGLPGEERLDVAPDDFRRRLALLKHLGFKPIPPEELLYFHDRPSAALSRRRYVVTVDDGFEDAVAVLSRHSDHRPQLFVPTALLGHEVGWARARVADARLLQSGRRAGVEVGSHTRTHPSLPELSGPELAGELEGSLADLRDLIPEPLPILAYPHGRHSAPVRLAARAAGYRAAYTTAPGRNGAGTDAYELRRISVKAWDSGPSFLWKVLTGEHVPARWEARLRRRHDRRNGHVTRPASSSS